MRRLSRRAPLVFSPPRHPCLSLSSGLPSPTLRHATPSLSLCRAASLLSPKQLWRRVNDPSSRPLLSPFLCTWVLTETIKACLEEIDKYKGKLIVKEGARAAKITKKIVLKLQCQSKHFSQKAIKRCKYFEIGIDKKGKGTSLF